MLRLIVALNCILRRNAIGQLMPSAEGVTANSETGGTAQFVHSCIVIPHEILYASLLIPSESIEDDIAPVIQPTPV